MSPHVPVSTYRLQLGPDFTFAEATGVLEHLHRLGITDVYLSPILAAAPGSTHGYDVVDHSRISAVLGGRDGFEEFAAAAHRMGLGVIVDVVPNHMAIPVPASHNRQLWDLLTHGRHAEHAHWFDIDLSAEGQVVLPFLGRPLAEVLAEGELTIDPAATPPGGHREQPVLCYFDHRFPIRPGTEHLPLTELLDRQHYRLAHWKAGEVNYRRFFDVDSLIAIRMEEEQVFTDTHRLLLELASDGWIDGLRIDHPDGLADPATYFDRLARASGGAWTVVEKILAPVETLPQQWQVDGTTGYDAAWRIGQVLTEPTGAAPLRELMHTFVPDELDQVRTEAKHQVLTTTLRPELDRIARLLHRICAGDVLLRDRAAPGALTGAAVELLTAADRYRAYEPTPNSGEDPAAIVHAWRRAAGRRLPLEQHPGLDLVTSLVLGEQAGTPGRESDPDRQEFQIRFQQLCGAAMAKAIEDTTYYRWTHLVSLCEVGGAPERFAIEPGDLYRWAGHIQANWPHTLTALSTHDAKRSEDVRARIGVLSEYAIEWADHVDRLRSASGAAGVNLEPHTENLLWQTLAGTWTEDGPPGSNRFTDYLLKAAREAGVWTSWTNQDLPREEELTAFGAVILASAEVNELMSAWRRRTAASVRAAILGARALQLTLPGVADTYQGTEITTTALVDPDNRRPVDYPAITRIFDRLEAGTPPWDLASAKLHLTAQLLRLRRRRAGAFTGPGAGFAPLPVTSDSALAFTRTIDGQPDVVTVATRRSRQLREAGGWQDHHIHLPEVQWHNVLTGADHPGGAARIGELLGSDPVAVLERTHR